jgi:hypothetical protein
VEAVMLAIDGLQPEKGHETLYVVRELERKRVWFAAGSFSFRTWGCTAGANELKGFVPHGVLLARHASHEPKPFPKVDPYESTASAPYRGLRRDSRLSPLSG